MLFAATGMGLHILREINQAEKDKYHMSLTCGIQNMIQMNLFTKQKHIPRHREQTYSYQWRASLVALAVKNLLQCRRPGSDLWVGKTPWRREWLPTSVFLPAELHGQRSLAGIALEGGHSQTQLSD